MIYRWRYVIYVYVEKYGPMTDPCGTPAFGVNVLPGVCLNIGVILRCVR